MLSTEEQREMDRLKAVIAGLQLRIQMKDEEIELLCEALKKISVAMPGSRDNELVLYYERIAREVLESVSK